MHKQAIFNGKKKNLEIAVVAELEMFGEVDVLNTRPRWTSCKAISGTNTALVITRDNFLSRLHNPVLWKMFRESVEIKDMFFFDRYE